VRLKHLVSNMVSKEEKGGCGGNTWLQRLAGETGTHGGIQGDDWDINMRSLRWRLSQKTRGFKAGDEAETRCTKCDD
jgi:hypothetical protein